MFTLHELNLIRRWFNAVQDMDRKYLVEEDYDLADRIAGMTGAARPLHKRAQPEPVIPARAIHTGTEHEAELRLSDLNAAFASPGGGRVTVEQVEAMAKVIDPGAWRGTDDMSLNFRRRAKEKAVRVAAALGLQVEGGGQEGEWK